MKNFFIISVTIVVVGVIGLAWYAGRDYAGQPKAADSDHRNTAYIIENERIQLANGSMVSDAVPGSASKIITEQVGEEVFHDLDGDGKNDAVLFLTHHTGGTGTFYYLVTALYTDAGYVGSHGFLLGDRIALQSIEIVSGQVRVTYLDRRPDEPMAAMPTVLKEARLVFNVEEMRFVEQAEQAGDGDTDGENQGTNGFALTAKEWVWVHALYNDGREVVPEEEGVFTLTFSSDGTEFTATTDCNQVAGSYTAQGEILSFGNMISTKMYCEGSQEVEFTRLLGDTAGFHFSPDGELILDLKFDSGSVRFR